MGNPPLNHRVQQLTGPGVEGFEYDPPMFHVDVPDDEIADVAADPGAYLRGLGLGTEHGLDVDDTSLTLTRPGTFWSHEQREWVRATVLEDQIDPVWCCYIVGDRMTCHRHGALKQ